MWASVWGQVSQLHFLARTIGNASALSQRGCGRCLWSPDFPNLTSYVRCNIGQDRERNSAECLMVALCFLARTSRKRGGVARGKIAEWWVTWDNMKILRQRGHMRSN